VNGAGESTAGLRRTPLDATHRALGARMVPFAGWEMPLQYAGIIAEHRAVRGAAGIFDLSHMGELWVGGPEAGAALGRALVTEPARLAVGRAHYSLVCAEDGGILDDVIVYRVEEDRFLVVPNAANAATVADALRERLSGARASLEDASAGTALVAVQGPAAVGIVARVAGGDLAELRRYAATRSTVGDVPALVARTGYTGEDGFELFVDAGHAVAVWDRLVEAGAPDGLVPCGLGARDTLRLEAGMPLYGNELDRDTTPFEAGLGWVVRMDRDTPFVGRAALEVALRQGPRRTLVGLRLEGPGIARHGHAVHAPGGQDAIGEVTSGTLAPTLGHAIAMARVAPDMASPGTMLAVAVRAARVPARVVELPFYRRAA
jgi:aminomethyltransferase